MKPYTPSPDRYDGRMPYRRCGTWGLKLPAISLGCWQNFGGLGPTENQRQMIYTAFDCGITHFDLANNYGPAPGSAEINVGKILKNLPRDEILVSTKAGYEMWEGPYGEWSSRKYLLASLDQSLKRLGMDYVDIFYSHRFDPDTPLEETMGALDTAVKSGKALYAGISSYTAKQTRDAARICRENHFAPLLIQQPNYSMLNRWIEKDLVGACGELGLGIIAFCPLYQGLLTDRYLNGIPPGSRATFANTLLTRDNLRPEIIQLIRNLTEHAKLRSQTLAQMALAWTLRDSRVTSALIGASRPEQILENVKAVANGLFGQWEITKLDEILEQAKMPPSPWATAPSKPERSPLQSAQELASLKIELEHSGNWRPIGDHRYLKIDYSQIGYCTNVHAGSDLETTRANLEKYALAVKRLVSPNAPMGIGLWLSANAAANLVSTKSAEPFAAWLREVGLVPYTFNGFPYGDFHQPVVKHRVYEPTWCDSARVKYTHDLIAIQNAILPNGMAGTISTMPIAWGSPIPKDDDLNTAAEFLRLMAEHLRQLEESNGRYICLCLEPEPGCYLQRSSDVVRFFQDYLFRDSAAEKVGRYLKVCHDVCHAAVMFESQTDVLHAYQAAGIGVGKIQISSAVCTPNLDSVTPEVRDAALAQLATFREERYLHQTCVRPNAEIQPTYFEDLPLALESGAKGGEWRVHFHVPIYLEKFGHLLTSRDAIVECLNAARIYSDVKHIEVETYAWGVLPSELQQPDLAAGIADELKWYLGVLENLARETE